MYKRKERQIEEDNESEIGRVTLQSGIVKTRDKEREIDRKRDREAEKDCID